MEGNKRSIHRRNLEAPYYNMAERTNRWRKHAEPRQR